MKNLFIIFLLCVGSTAYGKFATNKSSIWDVSLPDSVINFTTQPQSQTVLLGATATFRVVAPEGAFINLYQWMKNGSNIPGATNASFTVPVTNSTNVGNYTVAVTQFMGEFTGFTSVSNNAVLSIGTAQSGTKLSVVLNESSMTSAGVYDQNDNMVRTLWSGIRYPAGTFDTTWDGKNDAGVLVADAKYTVKVTANNISATYLGVIGNNSDSTHGPTVWRQEKASSLVFPNGHTGYVSLTNTEGSYPMFKFETATIHQKAGLLGYTNYQTNFTSCTDGNLVYVYSCHSAANLDNAYVFYIHAIDPSIDKEYAFSNGVDVATGAVPNIHNAIDSNIIINISAPSLADALRVNSCLAVQRGGKFLFSGHNNHINIYDKTTGAFIATSTISGAKRMVCDYAGNLWVAYNNTIKKYSVGTNGTLTYMLTAIGNNYPMSLDISPDNNTLITIDGSTQQVKAYNVTSGAATWTLGQLNGYYGNTIAANDKFYFKDDRQDYTVFVTYQPDGSFWIGDIGDNRILHYGADRTFIDYIMYQPATYFASIDPSGNKNHAYMGYLRFDIDYSNPLKLGWTFTHNYGARRLISNSGNNADFDRPVAFFTLSNGRTYTGVGEHSHDVQTQFEVVDTGFRRTGITYSQGQAQMDEHGNILQLGYTGGAWTTYKNLMVGFDANNNPTYSGPQVMESIPTPDAMDPVYAGPTALGNRLSDSTFVFFDNTTANKYHLGFLKHGASSYSKRTMQSTSLGYSGGYPTTGYYDIGNGVLNAGGASMVHSDIIYTGYHGEFWKQGQTNKWDMFDKNALFLYQFGKVKQDNTEEAAYGMAGNTLYGNVVTVGSNTYLFHQDESYHAGLLYWGIYNTDRVTTTAYPIEKKGTPVLTFPYMRLNDGLKWQNTLAMNDSSGWSRSSPENGTTILWSVNSGLKSDDHNLAPDISATYGYVYSGDSVMTVTKSLGQVSNTDWTMCGKINWVDNVPNKYYNNYSYGALQVLDDAGKVIATFTENVNTSIPDQNGADLIGNDKTLGTYTRPYPGAQWAGLNEWAPFSISAAGNVLTFAYGNNISTTTTLADPTANISRAASVRILCQGVTYSFQKAISLKELHFSRVGTLFY